jgi:DNA-binding MarR family transcriptional regulator
MQHDGVWLDMSKSATDQLMPILTATMVALVSRDEPDLTARQMAVLLVCDEADQPQTVRGLALKLNVAKPVITRAVDKLEEMGLLERRPDPADRRSVLIRATKGGRNHVRSISRLMTECARGLQSAPAGLAEAP